MNKSIVVLVNPVAGGGKGKRIFSDIEPLLTKSFEIKKVYYTERNDLYDQVLLGSCFLKPDYIIVIGGDGTLNLIVNAFLSLPDATRGKIIIGYYNAGTGGDFARNLPAQTPISFVDALVNGMSKTFDLGVVKKGKQDYFFMNVASLGVTEYIASKTRDLPFVKKIGGFILYLSFALFSLFRYRPVDIDLNIDNTLQIRDKILIIAFCNGGYFGGGVNIAPGASLFDGLLDVIIVKNQPKIKTFKHIARLYQATHLSLDYVILQKGRVVEVQPTNHRPLSIELDGEQTIVSFDKITISPQKIDMIL